MGKRLVQKTRADLRAHFMKRLKERYEITICERDVDDLSSQIRDRSNVLNARKQTHTRTLVDFVYKGVVMRGVYNTKLKSMVTVLPEEVLDIDLPVYATHKFEENHI